MKSIHGFIAPVLWLLEFWLFYGFSLKKFGGLGNYFQCNWVTVVYEIFCILVPYIQLEFNFVYGCKIVETFLSYNGNCDAIDVHFKSFF